VNLFDAATAALLIAAIVPDAQGVTSASVQLQATAAGESETLTNTVLSGGGLWKPIAYDPLIDSFYDDLAQLGKADAVTRQRGAERYGLTSQSLDATTRFLRNMEKDRYDRRKQPGLRAQALQLVNASNRAPISIMLAAGALSELPGFGCNASDAAALMDGSRELNRDLWAIASTCSSPVVLATAIDKATSARPALQFLALGWTRGDPASELAAADVLLRPEFLHYVPNVDRQEVLRAIAWSKLATLLNVGLLQEALAFGDSLPPKVRAVVLQRRQKPVRLSVAGFTIKHEESFNSVAIDYAAALALVDRKAEARALLDVIAPVPVMRQARACLDSAGKHDCHVGEASNGQVPLGALVVDQLLDEPAADPYPLAEAAATGMSSTGGGGVVEVLCHLLTAAGEQDSCEEQRASVAAARSETAARDDDRIFWAAVERAGGQTYAVAKRHYETELAVLGTVKSRPVWKRSTVDPVAPPFQELKLPTNVLANKPIPSLDPKRFAPLPQGFTPVRVARSANRVAAVSLSQRFDPDGEVTGGGYWLHLSADGGKSWQPPLYTGLAEHFPYVVPSSSRLPMIAGDRIHLEVEESLIDTASIMYPPVGTRIRRKRAGIYLDIPLAELRKDSDRNGITNIAAEHLLLDRRDRAPTPFVVGSDAACSRRPDAVTLARIEILKTLFHVEASALIEPVGGKKVLLGGWRHSEPTAKPPILVRGNPDDYRCLAIDRLMVIYSDADQERLKRFSPDFHLVELPPIRWNRDHTRGFVKWSLGWTGGTYRLVRTANGWNIESIGQWIT
jgi:hypothetical protein